WRFVTCAVAMLGLASPGGRAAAQAATGAASGRITDAGTGTPLMGVSVRVSGTQNGAQTADDGRFTLRGITPGKIELVVNRIGFEAKRVSATVLAGQMATVDVALSQAAFSLSEVVVTVTGAQKKAEISN